MLKDTLYAKYIKERDDREILEDEFGFITYKISGEECYINDMCIDLSERSGSRGRNLIEQLKEIALKLGCTFISANIYLADKGSSNTLFASLKVGFKVVKANHDILFIVKKIGGEDNG